MAKERILIVEDERIVAADIRRRLRNMGYSVCATVSSGREAIKKAKELRPDLVLMDIVLEGQMSGIQAAAEIRSGFSIPIVYLTAYADEEILGQAKATEPFGYIIKPFKDDELHSNIEMALYRHEMEEKLAKEQFKLKEYFENLPLLAYNVSFDGIIVDCNKMAVETLGYKSKDELIGKPLVTTVYAPSSQKRARQLFAQWKREEKLRNEELQIVTKKGKVIDILLNVDTIFDQNGEPLHSLSTQLDITERKKVGEALQESEEKYRNLVERANDGICIIQDGLIKYANPRQAEMWGGAVEEIIDTPFVNYVHPDDLPQVVKHYNRRMAGEQAPSVYETALRRKAGSKAYAELNIGIIKYLGKPAELVMTRDITERRQMQEALRESEEKFRIASQIASDVVYERDLQTGIATFYGDIDNHLGYESGEYPRTMEGWREHVHPEDLAWFDRQSLDQIEPGVPYNVEYRMRKKDGTYMTWWDRIMVIKDEKTGKPIKFIGAATDITERKRTEQALRESEGKFRSIVENSSDQIFMLDKDYRFLSINKTAADISKMSPQEMIGMSIFAIFPEETAYRFSKNIKSVFDTGKSMHVEEEMLVKGRKFFNSTSLNPVRDSNGGVIAVTGIVRDITQRKRAEEVLQRERDKAQKYLDIAGVMFVAIDAKGEVTLINRRGCEILGYEEGEIVGQNWFGNFLPERLRGEVKSVFEELMAGKLESMEYHENPIVTKSGEERWVAWHNTVLRDEKGNFAGTLSSGEDITERKRTEEALARQRDVAVALSSARDLAEGVDGLFDILLEIENIDCVGFYLVDQDTGALNMIANRGLPDKFVEKVSHLDVDSPYAKIAMEGKPVYQKAIDFPPSIREDLRSAGILFAAAIPIQHAGQIIGDLNIASRTCDGIHASAQHMLESVGAQIGESIARIQMEDALRKSEENYRNLVEKMPDVIYSLDKEGNITSINQAVKTVLGFEPEGMIGRNFVEFVEKGKLPQTRSKFKQILTGKKTDFETVMITKNGGLRRVELSSIVIKKGGKIVGSQGILRDITERRRSEEKLIRLSTAVKMSNDSVVISDIDANIIDVNEASLKMYGTEDKRDLVGKNSFELIVPEDREKASAALKEVVEKGYVSSREYRIMTKDGSRIPVEMSSSVMKSSAGKPIGFVGISRDITERKRAEEKVKASLREKELLLREIHHRVKNNLQVISSLINFQAQYLKGKLDREAMRELQNRIKSISMIHEKLYQAEDLAHVDLNDYIRDLTNALYRTYGVDPGKIVLESDIEDIALSINTAIPFGLIINELISNALKHSFPKGRGGKIKIALYSAGEDGMELMVEDNGVGMPEDLDFRKTESLGLKLVTILAEDQLHGKIELDRGGGTRFKIKLKVNKN